MRLLHTMLRVGNLERSIEFYVSVLGMQLLRKEDFPEGKFTLAFVGYGAEATHSVLELTYNYGIENYDLGKGYGHMALGCDDVYATCAKIRTAGGKIVREPGSMLHGTTILAFVEDPDGYKIELLGVK